MKPIELLMMEACKKGIISISEMIAIVQCVKYTVTNVIHSYDGPEFAKQVGRVSVDKIIDLYTE